MADAQALDELSTEGRLSDAADLDLRSTADQVALLAEQDAVAVAAVREAGPAIAAAVDLVVARLGRGGRLIEIGAGTPGRLALLDAAECGPTFGIEPGRVVGIMAGGESAATTAMEHGEDDQVAAERDLDAVGLTAVDVVIGITASGRTPYVLAALAHARRTGAATIAVTSNPGAPISELADVAIETPTGPEVISGSTRMKAGTAQKLVLNTISTLSMVQLGHTFGDLMVDVRATNDKLRRRALRVVVDATGSDETEAARALDAADGHAKTAIVMLLADLDVERARARLAASDGRVRAAITEATS